ncbi:hypothetical protein V1477_010840 [Vespula maculifrons]|uniref:Uncharacterized protein n=1 Tax=Vespula maculifrons TaxID=7453 RepID=A0ABD2C342_VESMC
MVSRRIKIVRSSYIHGTRDFIYDYDLHVDFRVLLRDRASKEKMRDNRVKSQENSFYYVGRQADHARPCQGMPGHPRPGHAMPGQVMPGQTSPDQTRPDQTRPANRSSKQRSKLPKLRRRQSPVNVEPYGPPPPPSPSPLPPLHPFPCLRMGVIDGCPSLQRSHVPRLGNRQLRYWHVSVSYTDYSCFLISLQIRMSLLYGELVNEKCVERRTERFSRVLREAGIKEGGREKFRKIYETLGHFGAQRENGRREP